MSTGSRWRAALVRSMMSLLIAGGIGAVAVPSARPLTGADVLVPGLRSMPDSGTKVGDRDSARGKVLRRQIGLVLEAQGKALMRHDKAAFLSPARLAEPRRELLRRYRNLTAMRVQSFRFHPDVLEFDSATGHWKMPVLVAFCFVVEQCAPDFVSESMTWADTNDGPELVSVAPERAKDGVGFAHPWEMSDLEVAIGRRVLVATTASLSDRLPELLDEAEKAAVVADEFAEAGGMPDLYRVYLADDNEWKVWYGETTSKAPLAGWTVPIGLDRSDVILNHSNLEADFIDETLRHELTHVSTLTGGWDWAGNWWLIEGIASLAEIPEGLEASVWSDETKQYIRDAGELVLPSKWLSANTSEMEARMRYGIAFLAVKYLDVRFGRAKLFDFFRRVLHGSPLNLVSSQVFGEDWAALQADCLSYIRDFANR